TCGRSTNLCMASNVVLPDIGAGDPRTEPGDRVEPATALDRLAQWHPVRAGRLRPLGADAALLRRPPARLQLRNPHPARPLVRPPPGHRPHTDRALAGR